MSCLSERSEKSRFPTNALCDYNGEASLCTGKKSQYESIYHKVNEKRQIKRTSLTMLLDMYPRFYKSLENTYGLRIWLAPREKQTLRTPKWLAESLDSYERLVQAGQRGCDIASILQLDLDQN